MRYSVFTTHYESEGKKMRASGRTRAHSRFTNVNAEFNFLPFYGILVSMYIYIYTKCIYIPNGIYVSYHCLIFSIAIFIGALNLWPSPQYLRHFASISTNFISIVISLSRSIDWLTHKPLYPFFWNTHTPVKWIQFEVCMQFRFPYESDENME